MTPLGRERWIVGGVTVAAALVVLISVWPPAVAVVEVMPITSTPIPSLRLSLTGVALTRPLFADDRDPEPTAAAEPLAATAQASPPSLAGIAAGGAKAVALVRTAAGETISARVGDVVDGWTLQAIARDHVLFGKDGVSETVKFDLTNKVKQGSVMPAAGPSGQLASIPLPPASFPEPTQ